MTINVLEKPDYRAPSGALSVSGGWKFVGSKGKGGGSTRAAVEAADSLHSTSYARLLFLMGEGEIYGLVNGNKSIYVDSTPLENADGTLNYSGVTVDFREGTQTQDYISGFPASESTESVGVEFTTAKPYTYSSTNTDLSAFRVTLDVPALTQQNTSNGDLNGYRVEYAIDLSTDGSAFEEVLSGAFDGKTTTTYARSHRIDLPKATSGWTVRVRRITAESTTATINDTTEVQTISSIIDGKLRYPMWSLLGIQFDASQFSSIPTISAQIYGRIIQVPSNYDAWNHTYSGTWDGTFKLSWTDNPAWIFYDLCLNERYGLGERIKASQIDKWSLYQIGQYCDEQVPTGNGDETEPRFTCNLYLQTQADAYKVLSDIAGIFRGIVYYGSGMAIPVADMPKDVSYTYGNSNVVDGLFTYTGTALSQRYNAVDVSWNDPDDMGRQKVESVEDTDGINRYGLNATSLTAFGCYSRSQAQRLGRYYLLTSLMETRTVSFSVGMDGSVASPGQIIKVADEYLAGRKISGRIAKATDTSITLDRDTTVEVGNTVYVMLPSGKPEQRTVSLVSDRVITVSEAFSVTPEPQALWVVESSDLVAQEYKVVSVTENDDGITYAISAIQHESSKFKSVDYDTKIDTSPISVIPPSVLSTPDNLVTDSYEVLAQGVSSTTVRFTWDKVQYASEYEVQWKRDNSDWVSMGRTGTLSAEVENAYTGSYIFRIRAISATSGYSVWANSTAYHVDGLLADVPVVTALTTTSIVMGITLNWVFPDIANIIEKTQIYYSTTNSFDDAIQLGDYAYPVNTATFNGLANGAKFYFWVRLVDKNGTIGNWYPDSTGAGVLGSSSADPAVLLDYLNGQITQDQLAQELISDLPSLVGDSSIKSIIGNLTGDTASGMKWLTGDSLSKTNVGNRSVYGTSINDNYAQGKQIDSLVAKVGDNISIIQQEQVVQADEISAMAGQINTVVSQVDENTASIQENAQTYADLNGKLSATYTIKAQVDDNGNVVTAGMGLGVTSESGVTQSKVYFLADQFALMSSLNGVISTPFVVNNGVAYINQAMIADATITTAMIKDANITTGKIEDASITNAKISDLAVTSAKITDASITSAKIDDLAVTTGKIADLSVQTLKIAGNAVTQTISANGGAPVSISITTSGGPVQILILGESSNGNIKYIRLQRNGSVIKNYNSSDAVMALNFFYVDTLAAGTYTYQAAGYNENDGVAGTIAMTLLETKR